MLLGLSEKNEQIFKVEISLFHEPWWLSAATDGKFQETVVKQGNDIVGRLPYVLRKRGPFRTVQMPPFTHMLGPAVDAGNGKSQTRLMRRLAVTRSLIDQLPPHSYFHQILDPSLGDGLAIADGLAFQERHFTIAPQYTFEVDCRRSLDEISAGMPQKTRQHIRRAQEKYSVRCVENANCFADFYRKNISESGRALRLELKDFPGLLSESRARKCGVILGAFDHDGTPVAMTYLAWGHGIMYYLLSTRSFRLHEFGSVALLIWSAMKHANEIGLILDLDGVYSTGTARFLGGFGGKMKTRLIIRRSRMPYLALQYLKQQYTQDESRYFT